MKFRRFKKNNKKKVSLQIGIFSSILLLTVIIVIKSFALYEEKRNFDIIKGQVPDQYYDVLFAYTLEDQEGNKTTLETMPEGKNYEVTITCDNGANGVWDYEVWGPLIKNLTTTRTKCKINFGPEKPYLTDLIKNETKVTTGVGLYEVPHDDAQITYTSDQTAINNLKQTEYRYAGKNPNNYINFNNEQWRIIGLVNTPEGSRVKLIRKTSLGNYSWDSSDSSINSGKGINEWSTSKMKEILNNGGYYNRTSGTCYNNWNNATVACDFSSTGLTNEAKEKIDTVTWNTGSNGTTAYDNISTPEFYNLERSNNIGKSCSGTSCNDTVTRTTSWVGKVGFITPSDYGYATSGGSSKNRETCLNTKLLSMSEVSMISECKSNNWLYKSNQRIWTIMPLLDSTNASSVFFMMDGGSPSQLSASLSNNMIPAIYLKTNVKVISGNGTTTSPYIME